MGSGFALQRRFVEMNVHEAFGLQVTSDVPVVVQYGRCDTRQRANAGFMPMGWPAS